MRVQPFSPLLYFLFSSSFCLSRSPFLLSRAFHLRPCIPFCSRGDVVMRAPAHTHTHTHTHTADADGTLHAIADNDEEQEEDVIFGDGS
jgi:hypothetical protein